MISNKFYETLLLNKKLIVGGKKDVISKLNFIKNLPEDFLKKPKRNKIKTTLLTPLEKNKNYLIEETNIQNHFISKNVLKEKINQDFKNKNSNKNQINNLFFFNYLSYSQSGKALVQISLVKHKTPINLTLWPRQKNFRYKQNFLIGEQLENTQRLNLELFIVGLLSSKVSESFITTNKNENNILLYTIKTPLFDKKFMNSKAGISKVYSATLNDLQFVSKISKIVYLSKPQATINKIFNLEQYKQANKKERFTFVYNKKVMNKLNTIFGIEIEELSRITLLTTFLVNTCNFYTKKILCRKLNRFVSNLNSLEIYEKEKLTFLEQLNLGIEHRFPFRSLKKSKIFEQKALSNASRAYWQDKISKELGFNNGNFTDWYRIYIADPEEKSSNIEWVAPDEYYQNHPIKLFNFSIYSFSDFANKIKKDKLLPFSTLKQKADLNQKKNQKKVDSKIISKRNIYNLLDSFDFSSSKFLSNKELHLTQKNSAFVFNKTDFFSCKDKIKQTESVEFLSTQPIKSIETNQTLDIQAFNNWKKINTVTKQPICWNNLNQLDNDFLYHTILMRCFNDAFCLIEENREILDLIADYLLRFELLRQPKLLKITQL